MISTVGHYFPSTCLLKKLSCISRLGLNCTLDFFLSMCVSLVSQSCLTLCNPMDSSLPGSSVHGDSPGKNPGVGSHSLLRRIFPTQGSNPGLRHCRWLLYCLSNQGNPYIHIHKFIYERKKKKEGRKEKLKKEKGKKKGVRSFSFVPDYQLITSPWKEVSERHSKLLAKTDDVIEFTFNQFSDDTKERRLPNLLTICQVSASPPPKKRYMGWGDEFNRRF